MVNKEMESSAVNLLSRMFGFRSAAICAVLASRKRGAFASPEERERAVEKAIDVGLEAMSRLDSFRNGRVDA